MSPASPSTESLGAPVTAGANRVYLFFALSCAITWTLAVPAARAWMNHAAPGPLAISCAGLSAFGPLLAVLAVTRSRAERREVFGRWRVAPGWVLLALVSPLCVHLLSTLVFAALGGHPDAWVHPPATAEALAALVVFPIGEEFGWRGFAHPLMMERHGLVGGSLLLGVAWGAWHLMYAITPGAGGFDLMEFGLTMVELPLYSLLITWVFERTGRSMAVAIAFHAGAHLDHIERAPRTDLRLYAAHLAVLAVIALLAARSLRRTLNSTRTASGD